MTDRKQQHGTAARKRGDGAGGTAKAPSDGPASAPDVSGAKAAGSPCPIAGIGASAGGLEAFTRLLKALPARVGMALVLVQHLDPTQDSMLADILGRVSKMPVSEATDGMQVESDHIYVMPPDVSIRVSGGAFALEKRPKPPTQVLPIDVLLRSLAEECENKAVGVVLSGTGSDGSLGLAAVKAAGGLTIAQEPSTAEYGGMPKAAIDVGAADVVLDPEHIAEELVRLGRHPGLRESKPADETTEAVDEKSLAKILSLVREATGLDLRSYRKTTLVRRISRRMLLEGATTMKEYLGTLQERPSEVEALYRDILVNMTEFFRDPDALDALKREVFPEVMKRKESGESIRIWVPGCAKGQEAYSILITLVELLDGKSAHPEIQMFASDVNELDVDFARAGVYPHGIVNEVSAERLARFFVQVPGGYQIDRAIRDKCVFAVHDITKDPPFSRLDLVSFRNVLIYMERPLQQRVLQILHYALETSGFLLLGASETTGTESAFFSVVDKKHRIYKRKTGPGKLLSALAPSAGALGFAQRRSGEQQEPAFDILGEAEKVVRGRYSPAGILVTADLDVLQFRGHVGRYLDPPDGPPEFKLPRLIDPALSLTVEAAIREAAKAKAAAKRRGTALEPDGEGREVDVEAVPIASPTGDTYYLVLFEERPKETPEAGPRTKRGTESAEEGETPLLRRQLDETREQLDAVVSERDATSADLRVASERFQSSNEELRTINEEFQTAQEELQSTNEELTTLNDELRNRNTDLGLLADDLNNVIEGVEIPILILDADLRIRRFTPQTEAIVSIVPADIGRPITDLSMKVGVPDFQDRVREVLRDGVLHETEVQKGDGTWYSVRIRPYKTGEGTVKGVVIAFVDIDELKKSTDVAEAAREHAEAIVDTVREPLLTLTAGLRVRDANDAFYRTFAVTAEETIGMLVYELGDGQWDFPQLRSLFEQVLPGDREFANLEVERSFPRVGNRIMMLSARRVREQHGQPSILLVINDVTEPRSRERLSASLNSISVTIGSTLELDRVLEQILKESSEALGAESSAVLFKQDTNQVVSKVYGMSPEVLGGVLDERDIAAGITSLGLTAPALLDHAEAARFVSFSKLDVELDDGSVLVVPLLLREEPIGWILFHYRSSRLTLGDSEIDFARRLGTLMSFTFENARLYATQREIAETLQAALLTVPRRIPGIDFGYLYRSATTSAAVGGDFYDLFELEDDRVAIVLGDVSGKGIQAAKLTALVKNTVRALAYEDESPATVLGKTSAVILKATPAEIFVTIMFCVLDTTSGCMAYCSAGHTTGIVKRAGGDTELLEVASPLTGAFPGVEFKDGKTVIEEDDLLVLYTDGVTEARQNGELFGEERLVELVGSMESLRPREVPETIFDEVLRFTGGKLFDDVAIVSLARARKA